MSQVDWTLLPGQPRRFFGLGPEAGKKDLKRAYAKLIKEFKPESHPEEFMRIRAAYEAFESALAYGVENVAAAESSSEASDRPAPVAGAPGAPVGEPPPAKERRPAPADIAPADAAPGPPGVRLSLRRGASTPPKPAAAPSAFGERLLVALRARAGTAESPLEPADADQLLQLALAREACAESVEAGELAFFETMLDGLRAFPRERLLYDALRAFFAELERPESIRSLLERARWWLRGGLFFYVTEGAWFRLGSLGGEREAAALLQEFLREDPGHGSATVFLLRFLRRHHDSVDQAWFEECLDKIQEQMEPGDEALAEELQFLRVTLDFLRIPYAVRERHPALRDVSALLKLICRGQVEENLGRFHGFYRKLGTLENACAMFSGPIDELMPAYRLLAYIKETHLAAYIDRDLDRAADALRPDSLGRLAGQLRRLVAIAASKREDSSAENSVDGGWFLYFLCTAIAVPWVVLSGWSLWLRIPLAGLLGFFGAALWLHFHERAFGRRRLSQQASAAWDTHELVVRPAVVEYLKAARVSLGELVSAFERCDQETQAELKRADPAELLGKDAPLAFHSLGLIVMVH